MRKINKTILINQENELLDSCVVCNGILMKRVMDLGFHPLADTFLKKEQTIEPQKLYPLYCLLCTQCGHVQNGFLVSPEERYIQNEYSYTSSNSKISRSHWEEFAQTVGQYVGLSQDVHVIEFGSNDGFLLQQFSQQGALVSGIDPSGIVAKIARKNDIHTVHGFVGKKTLDACLLRHGKAKLIVGNNVLNHIHELNQVIDSIRESLLPEGYFVCEFPYLADLVGDYIFDLIYHEHISYFSVKVIDYLLKKNKLYIARIEHNTYHGGSIRVFSTNQFSKYNQVLVRDWIGREEKGKLFSPAIYKKFMSKISHDKYIVLQQIYALKKAGRKIAAIGAGARGNTLLNFYKLDNTVIEFVTDNSKYKIGKFTPFTAIPIVDDTRLAKNDIDVSLILSWNIGKFLVEKIKKINPHMQFVVPGEKNLL